ncbi:MAG: hypothetical protein WD766_07530 [Gemmatimonadota bacterium]
MTIVRALGALPVGLMFASAVGAMPSSLGAQTDYFNTDRNRPVRIEDAHATERYALEVKLAPVRLERGDGGVYSWSIDPELAYGILPRTNLEVGLPLRFAEGDGAASGLEGAEISLFHNLNTETRTLPALAVRGDLSLPVGALGPDRVIPAVAGIVTRSFGFGRVHVNARYAFADRPESEPGDEPSAGHEDSRWLAGLAVDRPFPLNSVLLIAEVYADQPLPDGADLAWNAGGGFRYQVNPYLAVDAGLGRRLTGHPSWFITVGSALHLGVRRLIPGVR